MNSDPIPSWTKAGLKMSVIINGVFLPFKETPDALHRFVRPALFSTTDAMWELQYFGSATMVKYRGRNFSIITAHQTGNGSKSPEPKDFVVIRQDGEKTVAVFPKALNRIRVDEDDHKSLEDLLGV